MKKLDFAWLATLAAVVVFLIYKPTHEVFISMTKAHPYLIAFIKFALLATMGELLALRIVNGDWKKPVGLFYRAVIWGLLGMSFVLVFAEFADGVTAAMKKGLLPSFGTGPAHTFFFALFTSASMNLFFAPTFMAFHRVTDTYVDLGNGSLSGIMKVKLKDVVKTIDWNGYISFVVCKTVPFFWIPAHTITFSLPPEYRVLMAAFLSIALGAILAYAKKKSATPATK